ncbi:MAG: hypothetical protein HRU20_09320 [Pseudomonadales bacterium]|nr:hypothetical protein [Pseudomonadales bacterium]
MNKQYLFLVLSAAIIFSGCDEDVPVTNPGTDTETNTDTGTNSSTATFTNTSTSTGTNTSTYTHTDIDTGTQTGTSTHTDTGVIIPPTEQHDILTDPDDVPAVCETLTIDNQPVYRTIPVVFRDFLAYNENDISYGHVDFQNATGSDRGYTKKWLGADHLTVYEHGDADSPDIDSLHNGTVHGQATYNQWFSVADSTCR